MLLIDNVTLDSPFILAPLAGYTDLPFRSLCRHFGAGLCVSEMISCHGLVYKQKKTQDMIVTSTEERPVSIQLFGADPEIMAQAASILSKTSPDFIDINMGCPVKKVTKKGAGAALMKDPLLASTIIKKVIKESGLPVTVKFRRGTDNTNINAVEFAKMAQDAGVSAVTVHGRTWSQGFSGVADWKVVADVKKSVTIPVIGNGDILSYQDGLMRMEQTGCDGVMVGRGAMGNPWVFTQEGKPGNIKLILPTVFQHLQLMEEYLQTDRLLGCIKNHIGRYFKGLPGSSAIRRAIYDSPSFSDIKDSLKRIGELEP